MADEVRQLLGEGAQLLKEGKLEEAIAKLRAAVNLDPSHVQAHSYLGAAYAKAGQNPAAVEQFQAAVDLDPDNPALNFNLGQAFETAGSKPRARALYEKALALDPKYARAQQRLEALGGGSKPAAARPAAPQPAAQTSGIPGVPPMASQPTIGQAPSAAPTQYGAPPSQYGAPPQYGSPTPPASLGLGRSAYGGYAASWRRFVAALLDGLILGMICGIATIGFRPATPTVAPGAAPSPQAISSALAAMGSLQLVYAIVAGIYFVGFHSWRGQTPGKMALNIKVLKMNGDKISVGTALGRFIVQEILSGITCGLAYIAILVNSENRGLHDQALDTMVVDC